MEEFDKNVLFEFGKLGIYGLQVPEKLNGLNLSYTDYTRLAYLCGMYDLALFVHLAAHQDAGYKGLMMVGENVQKFQFIPDLVSGKKIAACCGRTQADGTSKVAEAILSDDQKHYVLNGTYNWVVNGGIADIFTVFAQTPVKDNKGIVNEKFTAFIVERGFGGVTHSNLKKSGIKALNTATVDFEDCKVPIENVLGVPGEGFKIEKSILTGSHLGTASALAGAMGVVIKQAAQHAEKHVQFGKSLKERQHVQEKLAKMAVKHHVTESMAFMLAGLMDSGVSDYELEADMCKIYASEAAWYCVDEAVQILGDCGFTCNVDLERIFHDVQFSRLFEHSNHQLRFHIALTGFKYLKNYLTQYDLYFWSYFKSFGGILFPNAWPYIIGMFEANEFSHHFPPQFQSECHQLGKMFPQFLSYLIRVHTSFGSEVEKYEYFLTLLTNISIEYFALLCTLSRYVKCVDDASETLDFDLAITKLALQEGILKIRRILSVLSATNFNIVSYTCCGEISSAVAKQRRVVQSSPLQF